MKMSVSKKAEKVIKEGLEEMMQRLSLREVTTIGARMMLRVAIEDQWEDCGGIQFLEEEGSK